MRVSGAEEKTSTSSEHHESFIGAGWCVHVCICVYVCVRTRVCVYVFTCLPVCVFVSVHACTWCARPHDVNHSN